MAQVDDRDYSEEEALKMLKERSGLFLPGWFALDEGFYTAASDDDEYR